jgi:hypothetical protein
MIATTSALGLVKSTTTGTTAGRYYDVEVEADGTMRVNVPWTYNDTWKPNSDTQEGYVAQAGKTLAGRVWKVDTDGKPKWLAHSSGTTYSAGSNISISSNTISVATNPNFGTGYVTAAYYVATSDRRLKENLVEFIPKQSILDLPIYKYDFIEGDKNQIGCMAQDLQKICPELIKENDETGYLSIQESKIVYLLIDEVKKLKS